MMMMKFGTGDRGPGTGKPRLAAAMYSGRGAQHPLERGEFIRDSVPTAPDFAWPYPELALRAAGPTDRPLVPGPWSTALGPRTPAADP